MEVDYKTIKLFKNILQLLAPPPILKVSDWADNYRKLSAEASAEPGQWNTNRAPYQREIMNAVNDSECEEVIIMSSSQIGKTELILNILGYYIDYDPSPIMVIQPTLEMAQTFSKDRLSTMLRDTPVLKNKVKDAKSKDSENTILHKKFPGGHITIVGANSPAGLASRPIKILLCDEVDRYPSSAGTEGSPIELAEKRTTTFWNRKKIKVSTPTIKGVSKIEMEYENSSKEEWCISCPCCQKLQPYEWGRINFLDVTMQCKFCDERFSETEWKEGKGQYIAKNENKKKRGFHLNELASPWKHWEEIIEDYRKAKKVAKENSNIEPLKVWYNTSMGETWEEKGEKADENSLLARREYYKADMPEGVLVLTAGIDVQDNRFEIEVVGWGAGYESWGIIYHKIQGDLSRQRIWDELESFLSQEFYFENNNALLIAISCIDTGGHFTTQTYKFLKSMSCKQKMIYGIKGMGGSGMPLIYKTSTNNSENVRIFLLGVDAGKEILMSRLKIKDIGAGYCHFPINVNKNYDEMYMKGLTSEQRIIRNNKKGIPEIIWIKQASTRNEALDLRNYATAAIEILKPDWNVLEKKIKAGINYMKKISIPHKKTGVANKGVEI